MLTEQEAAAVPGALRVFERVAAAEQDADAVWLTLLPGFPEGSYGWAQVDRMLGDDLGPRLYVEPVGQGDSDKPRDYPYSTVERADLIAALWQHHGVRRTVVVTLTTRHWRCSSCSAARSSGPATPRSRPCS